MYMSKRLAKQISELAANYSNDPGLQNAFEEGAQLIADETVTLEQLADEREQLERQARIATATLLGAAAATVITGGIENIVRKQARINRATMRKALNR